MTCYTGSTMAVDKNKKTDMAEHLMVFFHAGLLINEPPGTAGLLPI